MSQLRTAAALLLATLFVTTGIDTRAAGHPKPKLDTLARAALKTDGPTRLIVHYRPGSSGRIAERLRARGAKVKAAHRRLRAITVEADRQTLSELANDPDVAGISTDVQVYTDGVVGQTKDVEATMPDAQFLRATLGLASWPKGGYGVGVAIIDSGIAPVADLASRIAAFYDFTKGGVAATPSDAYGHGTHVAGLIAGSGWSSDGKYVGLAASTRLIGLKVLDDKGRGYTSDVIAAVEFATEHRAALGVDVINLSLGHPILEPASTDPLVRAVERAVAAGSVVVTAAGNVGRSTTSGKPGYAGITSPGNAPSALTVGSLDMQGTASRQDDSVGSSSARGPTWYDSLVKPDVLAPGVGLIAAASPNSRLALQGSLQTDLPEYIRLTGTSMSAAVTSGVVSLMIAANRADNPNTLLTPNSVKLLLQFSALPVTPQATGPIELEEGAGGVNAAGAVELARAINPDAAVGWYWLEVGVRAGSWIANEWLPWTRRVTWGNQPAHGEPVRRREHAWTAATAWGSPTAWSSDVWLGDNLVSEHFSIWSSQLVKNGAATMTSDHGIVWSTSDDDHIVWGNCAGAQDDHIVWGNCTEAEDDHIVWGNSAIDIDGTEPVRDRDSTPVRGKQRR